jgi:hypothetical protein
MMDVEPEEPSPYPPDDVDGLTFDLRELPVEVQPVMDLSIFDDVPLDEDGLPILPPDFDESRLPGFSSDSEHPGLA